MPSRKQRTVLMRVMPLAVCGILLAGCASNQTFQTLGGATGQGGVCDAFPRPQYQIRGVTAYDQKWADETTEAGVAGCKWKRPEARPQWFDSKPSPAAKVPVKKKRWYDRFRRDHVA